MKKLMTFVSVAVFAALTQAASFNWTAAIAQADGSTAVGVGSTVYLIYSVTDIFGGAPATFDTTTGITDLGGTLMATHTITSTESAGWVFTDSFGRADAAGGVNGYWQLVMVDSSNPTEFSFWSTQLSGLGDATGTGLIDFNSDWSGSRWLGDNSQPTVVPEPTSMALLALGVAALGLRRKVRK